jgi:hypothetical protein
VMDDFFFSCSLFSVSHTTCFVTLTGCCVIKAKLQLSLRFTRHHARWRWVVSFTLQPFYPQGKSTRYPLNRRLGGSQSQSGHGGEEKNSQPLPVLEPPIIQPAAQHYTTEQSRLLSSTHFVPAL